MNFGEHEKTRVIEEGGVKVVKATTVLETLNVDKLRRSIAKAVLSAGLGESDVQDILDEVLKSIVERKKVTTKDIRDLVEKAMVSRIVKNPKWEEAAKRYLLARIYNQVYGKGKWRDFDPRDLRLTYNALKLLEIRYLLKDPETQRIIETPQMLFRRVARHLARVERLYGKSEEEVKRIEDEFYRILSELRFIPNTPTLMNAETRLGILSACFVIPVRDALSTPDGEGIMDAVRAMALIQQQGGGTGFDFSELRPEGDVVASTSGVASGPLSFMRLFDTVTDVIKQGGKRRGANMGVMHVWHPDIEKFIKAKTGEAKEKVLQNFNISVGVYDEFMKAVLEGREWKLVNPRKTFLKPGEHFDSRYYAIVRARHNISEEWVQEVILRELEEKDGSIPLDETLIITLDEAYAIAEKEGAIRKTVNARELFYEIVKGAWEGGDPGMLFMDEINRRHPVWYLGKITATNPCGEEPLLPWENCNLGSINLEKYVVYDSNGEPRVDWEGLARDVRVAVRFLDNVIDANKHPLKQIEEANKLSRKIGLGVMGWAHMLIKLGIPYDSVDAVYLAYHLAEWIAYNAYLESVELAKEKGVFPAWNPELYRPMWWTARTLTELLETAGIGEKPSARAVKLVAERPPVNWGLVEKLMREHGLRNAALLSIAPTGSISIIAGATSSIEPVFALAFMRYVSVGTFLEVDRLFLEYLRRYEMDEPELLEEIAKTGSIAHFPFMPRTLKKLFRTAHDIDPVWHVLHQAAWQQWIDAAVSKTINMRSEATVEDVWEAYILAWRLGCKGITVYRDKSRREQVIYFGLKSKEKEEKEKEKTKITLKTMAKQYERKTPLKITPEPVKETRTHVQTTGTVTTRQATVAIVKSSKPSRPPRKEEDVFGKETRMTPKRFRIGKKEYITVAENYAGGCPTCDI